MLSYSLFTDLVERAGYAGTFNLSDSTVLLALSAIAMLDDTNAWADLDEALPDDLTDALQSASSELMAPGGTPPVMNNHLIRIELLREADPDPVSSAQLTMRVDVPAGQEGVSGFRIPIESVDTTGMTGLLVTATIPENNASEGRPILTVDGMLEIINSAHTVNYGNPFRSTDEVGFNSHFLGGDKAWALTLSLPNWFTNATMVPFYTWATGVKSNNNQDVAQFDKHGWLASPRMTEDLLARKYLGDEAWNAYTVIDVIGI